MSARAAVRIALLAAAVALVGGPLRAQSPAPVPVAPRARLTSRDVLRALGLSDTARVVIIHADDAAITPGVDRATLEALRTKRVSSASIMATTPYLAAFAAALPANARYDLGVHLAFTSESPSMRWGPVAPRERVRSLIDDEGMLRVGTRSSARPDEIERELEAQLARVRAAGITVSHLDSHQGALLYHGAERFEALRRIAKKNCLLIPVPETFFRTFPYLADALDDGQAPLADMMSIDPATEAEDWEKQYIELFSTMRAGVTLLLVHVGEDAPEERAAFREHTEYGLPWRVRDDSLVRSGALREMARWHGVTVISWAEMRRIARVC